MKARLISKSIIENERLIRCGFMPTMLFQRLIMIADDCGRCVGNAVSIKTRTFPNDEEFSIAEIERSLSVLEKEELIRFYEVKGRRYLYLTGWEEHQVIKFKHPEYPAPEAGGTEDARVINNIIISVYEEEAETETETETETEAIPSLSPPVALPEAALGGEPTPRAAPSVRDSDGKRATLFDRFWAAYPRRLGRFEARYAFEKLGVDNALLAEILRGIDGWRESEEWTRDGGRFIPSAATFLKGRRWEDVPPRASPSVPSAARQGSFDTDDFFSAALNRPFHIHRED